MPVARARAYPVSKGGVKWFHDSNFSSCGRRAKRRWVWASEVAKKSFWSRAHCSLPRPATPRCCLSKRRTTRKMYSGTELLLPVLSEQLQADPRGNIPSTSSSRWPWLSGGAGACLNSCYAACACGTKNGVGLWRPCRGKTCGGMLVAMARIFPARPDAPLSTITFLPLYA